MRAMVDGELASPSDVVFAKGDFAGTHAFTFTKKSLTAGPHVVRAQWWWAPGDRLPWGIEVWGSTSEAIRFRIYPSLFSA